MSFDKLVLVCSLGVDFFYFVFGLGGGIGFFLLDGGFLGVCFGFGFFLFNACSFNIVLKITCICAEKNEAGE